MTTETRCENCGDNPVYRHDVCKHCDARILGVQIANTHTAHEILEATITSAILNAHIDPRDVRALVEKVIANTRPYGLTETWQEMHGRMVAEHADEDVMR